MQQFLEGEHKSGRLQPHHQTPSSTLPLPPGYHLLNEKKHSEKQSRHRIGHRFRNSWGRKDNDHLKTRKKSNSLVIILFFFGFDQLLIPCIHCFDFYFSINALFIGRYG